jgi:hypothetical protein
MNQPPALLDLCIEFVGLNITTLPSAHVPVELKERMLSFLNRRSMLTEARCAPPCPTAATNLCHVGLSRVCVCVCVACVWRVCGVCVACVACVVSACVLRLGCGFCWIRTCARWT